MTTSNTPTPPGTPPNRTELAAQLSRELEHLRDSLVSLSLCLKDWQFVLDRSGARQAQRLAEATLAQFTLQQSNPVGFSANSRRPVPGQAL